MGASSVSSAWGKSWLASWLSSWGKTAEPAHSGMFRMWLTQLQAAANAERDEVKKAEVPLTKTVVKLKKKAKPLHKVKDTVIEEPKEAEVFHFPMRQLVDVPSVAQMIAALPQYTHYSLDVYRDSMKQNLRKKKQRDEEEMLILLVA